MQTLLFALGASLPLVIGGTAGALVSVPPGQWRTLSVSG
jgi:hypothetical protein